MNKTINNLTVSGCILLLAVMFVLLLSQAKNLPILLVLGALVVYRLLIGVPYFVYSYYKMKDSNISIVGSLLPVYNESAIMQPTLATVYLGLFACIFLECLAFLMPLSVVQTILGANAELIEWYVLLIRILLMTYAVMSIVRGIAYVKIFIDIEETKCYLNNMKPRYGLVFFLSCVMTFIPLARTIALSIQQTSISKAVKSQYIAETPMKNNQYDWNNYQ